MHSILSMKHSFTLFLLVLSGYQSASFAWTPSIASPTRRCYAIQKTGTSQFSRSVSCLHVQSNAPLDESASTIGLLTKLEASITSPDQQQNKFSWNDIDEALVTKILNACLLLSCFGFALYTIVSVDNGMTRGWTQSEIAMRIPVDNWSSYESALAESPIVTKTTINVIIYLLGDWLSQTVFAKKNILDFDAKRTLRNGFIGLCFGPLVHMYYEWSDTILPVEAGIMNRVKKILMDQTLYLSIKCSIYISAVGLLAGEDWEDVQQTVKERIGPVCFTAWKFWPLVHVVTYSVVPARHRILWVNCVDLVWNAILSTLSRKIESVEVPEPLGVAVLYSPPDEPFINIQRPVPELQSTINQIILDGAGVKEHDENSIVLLDKEQQAFPLYEPPRDADETVISNQLQPPL